MRLHDSKSPKRIRQLLFWLVLIVFILVIVETISFMMGRILQDRAFMYRVPSPQADQTFIAYEDYLALRDPYLGWPFPSEFNGEKYDSVGSRRVPAFEDPEKNKSCVSLYGESFTYGGEVDHEHAWGNLLSQLLECRVSNFGVGSYGTDQAFLRYQQNVSDESKIVILGYLSENIFRNLTRNRDLQSGDLSYAMKPRFILDAQGDLELVRIPQLSEVEYRRWIGMERPQLNLEHENFDPGGSTGAVKLEFPFSISILRNLNYYRMRAKLAGRPPYLEFYSEEHPLDGLEITVKIIKSFTREAYGREQVPVVVIFPTKPDLIYHNETGQWSYQNLLDELDNAQMDYLDFGPYLLNYLGQRDWDEIFAPKGHYNEGGNQVVAKFIAEYIEGLESLPDLNSK